MKKKLLIAVCLLSAVCGSLLYLRHLFNVGNYKAVIDNQTYFSFLNGHVYRVGDTVFLAKNGSPGAAFTIREHLTGATETLTWQSSRVVNHEGKKYDELNPDVFTDYFIIPKPGLYIVTLKGNKDAFHGVFFANDTAQRVKKIKVVISDYTWVCYNDFGGRSKYKDRVTPGIVKFNSTYFQNKARFYNLNIHKPNTAVSHEIKSWINDGYAYREDKLYHLAVAEMRLLELLCQRHGIEAIELMDCLGFENYEGAKKDQLFIFNGHSEYWTERMIYRLKNLRNSNNILFFSGNNVYRMVKRNNESLNLIENKISPTVTTELTGLYYTTEGYMANGRYRIKSPEHFLFNNIKDQHIGGPWVVSIESDKINQYTPHNVELLASGSEMPGDMILMHTNGYHLLNTGSVGSHYGLSDSSFRKVIMNFIDHSLSTENRFRVDGASLAKQATRNPE
jgi:hypothetical protein